MPVNDNGFWEGEDASEHHINDQPLASYLVNFFKEEKAIRFYPQDKPTFMRPAERQNPPCPYAYLGWHVLV